MELENIRREIRNAEDELISLASEMIGIPSPTGQEGQMAQWLQTWLETRGFEVEAFDIDPEKLQKAYPDVFYPYNFPYENRPNVVGRLPGTGGGRSLMVNFHLDVVDADPNAWQTDPWKGTVEDGVLYGRGAADMKGGAASALFAVDAILQSGIRLNGDLLIAGVIEEEGPGNGTLAVQARGLQADGCLIPEPTNLALAPCLTGGAYCIITVPGRSSHSTTAWEGVNAMEKACRLLPGIEAWRTKRRQQDLGPLYRHAPETAASSPVINLTRVDGANIGRVPSAVQLWTRASVMPGEDPKEIAEAMEKDLLAFSKTDPWLAENPPQFLWVLLGGRSYPAALDLKHPLIAVLSAAMERAAGHPARVEGFVSPADMQQLLNIAPRTPTIMYGPGDIYAAHSDREGVPIRDLQKASETMADFIAHWCGSKGPADI